MERLSEGFPLKQLQLKKTREPVEDDVCWTMMSFTGSFVEKA